MRAPFAVMSQMSLWAILLAVLCGLGAGCSKEVLRASHQWPGGTGDLRDEMVEIIASDFNAANLGLTIRVYPGASLFKAEEQWRAMVTGALDISAFPLSYAGGRHPEFNLTLMPGLIKNHEHARRFNQSPAMNRIKQIMNDAGVIVLADTWLAGGFASKNGCILEPENVQRATLRAAGKSFEQMLAAAGASITSMASSEVYTALQTGVLDGVNTSSESFVSYRIYEQVQCLTAPGDYTLWFMYEPILMSKQRFDGLNEQQQAVLLAAGKKAEEYAYQAAKKSDQRLIEVFRNNDVEVVTLTSGQMARWLDTAKESSYRAFAADVPGGSELIEAALAVE